MLSHQTITAPNPAEHGAHKVNSLFYGSGTDKQRREFGDGVTIKTKTVDVSPFATVAAPQAKTRSKFWGFDLKKAPINGRVWYPEGAGPFPLVLIVHGNHNWREFSDPGYQYLGELLASRGFILASVDENFINGLSGENDGRAWLLLKHLEAWKQFNESQDGPLKGKVDMSRIALMGHSRGGEAAAVAATFNRLKYYPDNFKQEFKFNFAVKAVVAIAPVDGQYKPTGQFTPLENVNYLLIHGSHDGDVSTAQGLRQYERLRFTDGQPWFKSVHLHVPRESRPVEHRLGQQGQRSAQRPHARSPHAHRSRSAAPVRQGRHLRLSRGDAQRQARLPADVPRPSHRRRVAAKDDVYDEVSGGGLSRARRVRRRRRPDDRLRSGRHDRRRASVDVERERRAVPRPRHGHTESQRRVDRLEQPDGADGCGQGRGEEGQWRRRRCRRGR